MLMLLLAAWLQAGAPPAHPGHPPMLRTIDKGAASNVDDAKTAVVRDAAAWKALWQRHASDRELPAVDFSKEMVVAVFLGSRTTSGYDVAIQGTRVDDGKLVVDYRESSPPRDAMTAQVITAPFHIAAVPARSGDVRFEKIK
jgi:hypothetical protein